MNKLFTILLFSILFQPLSTINAQNKDWTLLIYLDGSDLESDGNAGTTDLAEMMDAGNTENVNVIVTTGGANKDGWRTIRRFKIENGQQIEIPFTASDNAMSNEQNLTDFINWGIENYPANKYALDLWNHGMSIRGYAHDENVDQQIKVPQIKSGIGNSNFIKGGNKFELIGFDACLMATLEVQSTLSDFGNYMVSSEETEPGHGWNYTPIIKGLESNGSMNGEALGIIIADGFKAQGTEQESSGLTLSVVELSQIAPLANAIENLLETIKAGDESTYLSLQKARATSEEYGKAVQTPEESEDMVDIGDLMTKLKKANASLAPQANAVLAALNTAVKYTIKDSSKPKSSGLTMYIPHNKLENKEETQRSVKEDYTPIDFPAKIKTFIGTDYLAHTSSDNEAPAGSEYDFDDETQLRGHNKAGKRNNEQATISGVLVHDTKDLEQVQVVLLATSFLGDDEFVLLGSTFPDTCKVIDEDSKAYGYLWDEFWLGINGYPAYISHIFDFDDVNENGDTILYTRVQIPAILNPTDSTDGRDIILTYVFDDDFNIELESIVPETYGDAVKLTAKERINLKPGDVIQLLYEGFNDVTGEDFFVVDDNAIFTIENGNSDLQLEYDELEEGDYVLGYKLTDFSQNDTIIYDTKTYSVSTTTVETFANNNIELFPNPSDGQVTIDYKDFTGKEYQVQLFDATGRLTYDQTFNQHTVNLEVGNLPVGYYVVKLITADKIFSDKLIIQR